MQFPPDFRSRHRLERFKLSLKGGQERRNRMPDTTGRKCDSLYAQLTKGCLISIARLVDRIEFLRINVSLFPPPPTILLHSFKKREIPPTGLNEYRKIYISPHLNISINLSNLQKTRIYNYLITQVNKES